MLSHRFILTCVLVASVFLTADGTHASARFQKKENSPASYQRSIVRISSTNQAFDHNVPWKKQAPYTRKGIGTVVDGQHILVTAELIADHNFIELELPTNSKRCQATVDLVDYDGNLALLKPVDPDFLKGYTPLPLDLGAKQGDSINLLQLERNGSVIATPGTITSVMVGSYPMDDVSMLLLHASLSLQYRDNSFVLPAVNNGKLVGLLMRYDMRSQYADIIPPQIIAHFLDAAKSSPYKSFPRAEMSFAPLRDPQLRKYLGMGEDLENRGVYVTNVTPGGPANNAGIKAGDVLLSVAGKPLDAEGNFNHPLHGLIPFSYLTNTESVAGQEIPFTVFRDGKSLDLSVKVEPRDITKMISEPYTAGKAPDYYVLGGLVFQELSRDYLREWGKNWQREAPQRLVYYDQFQQELPADRGKIVILNQVLANDAAYGYDDLRNLVVKSVNNKLIKSLRDLVAALDTPVKGYHRIEFEEDPGVIYLDPDQVEQMKKSIQQQYNLPALENLSATGSEKPSK